MKKWLKFTKMIVLIACLSVPVAGSEAEEKDVVKIGVTLPAHDSSYLAGLADTLIQAGEREDAVEIETVYADWDAELQVEQIRTFLEKEMDAIILCPVNAKSFLNVLKETKKAGVPVIDVNMKLDAVSSEYIATYVGASMSEEADLAADLVIEELGETGGSVGIIEGAPGSDPQIYRTQTFLEQLTNHPDIEVVNILNGGWSYQQASLAAYDLLTRDKNLKMIYCHDSEMALGAYEMLERMGREQEIKLIGIGSQQEYLDAVRDGKLYALITQPVEFEAAYALSCAKRAARGETLRAWYKNSVQVVTRDNVANYKEIDYSTVNNSAE